MIFIHNITKQHYYIVVTLFDKFKALHLVIYTEHRSVIYLIA